MGKLTTVLVVFTMIIALRAAHGKSEGPKEVEDWWQNLNHAREKITKLRFYFHDFLQGKTPTTVRVAQAKMTDTSPTIFGEVNMMDDPLTVGPKITSELVGRAHGFYSSSSQEEIAYHCAINFVFGGGEYNGSSLSVLGYNPVMNVYREMPIVGGSGAFRLARGVATLTTYAFNFTQGSAIVEVNLVVLHY
ncbi:hypothetical protein RJ639_013752 [Escallonia herrerae]|uniref:Dirigent protein n=1 Tax=Escallonia herrerae TaxID=1293975 RepID=A0AA89APP3_9ASTE|nr:hypothetical protein RJ639_013752 [Escallonia herrerae]